ncbi:E3 ubiquitin-protein ligase TRIM69-like [Colossoma macropomum]|uniref:E3 ubiquitin-protein ligase TRIM69-like n=1 Tax=Colossoma macropomum TaxID=42526 RepID=UPI00186446CB|nr:E3 ubiquitin-protein ligase TRIM69-like [Colossoma macropomum]
MKYLNTCQVITQMKTSDITDLQVQTVRRGDQVTVKCEQKAAKDDLVWYQQSLGKLPQYVVRKAEIKANSPQESKPEVKHRFSRAFNNSRFTVDEETFDLSINGVKEEDIGIYFCGKAKSAALEFISGTFLLFADDKTDHHPPPESANKNEEPVKLLCSVQAVTLNCSGEHSLYWIRHGSGESHPGIIYIHPHTRDECEKSSETDSPTQSCVYKLPKRNLSLSDAGTHYCAVAACEHEGESRGKENNTWIIVALTTSNMASLIVMILLGGLLCKKQQKGSVSGRPGSPKNEVEDTDALNYVTLKFAQKPPSRASRVKESQDIYSQVKEKADSEEVFRALLRCIERSQAELLEVMEEKQKAAERQAEEFIKELEQEITELKRRDTELEQLSHTEDHLHLLQVYPSLCSCPHTKNWTDVRINTHLRVETLRRALTQLQEELSKEMEKFVEIELKAVQQYAVDVTLDPDTANPHLILSDDGKQVTDGDTEQNLPDNPERFDYCVNVLGKEGFSSGRFYCEVQVSGKTEWALGVSTESSNRKGEITLSPEDGYWTVWLRNETKYEALESPSVPLSLKQAPQKVGVFVDYEEGLVSFYDVEARSHIYSFTGQSFTEKLYPYFSPCGNYGGENSAPLIITPVDHDK